MRIVCLFFLCPFPCSFQCLVLCSHLGLYSHPCRYRIYAYIASMLAPMPIHTRDEPVPTLPDPFAYLSSYSKIRKEQGVASQDV